MDQPFFMLFFLVISKLYKTPFDHDAMVIAQCGNQRTHRQSTTDNVFMVDFKLYSDLQEITLRVRCVEGEMR